MAQLQFTLNGRQVTVEADLGASLLGSSGRVRPHAGQDGCSARGSCSACTVIVDGRAVVSCAQPAEARLRAAP
jgi:aerobic-type carbon monoxide dehydrogenase small subunit (CoxS/CutS family)